MLGRLARYLRFVGCDTEYGRGLSDDQLLRSAEEGDRVILTRDRGLALRSPRVFLIDSTAISEQFRAVRARWPETPAEPRFERCTECNGVLAPYRLGTHPERETSVPRREGRTVGNVFACGSCGHLYWEGSHTARVRERLRAWAGGGPA